MDVTTSPGSAQHTAKNASFATNLIILLEYVAVNRLLPNKRAYLLTLGAIPHHSRKVHEIEQNEMANKPPAEESQDLFIESLQVNGLKKATAWFTDLNTNGGKVSVKLDT